MPPSRRRPRRRAPSIKSEQVTTPGRSGKKLPLRPLRRALAAATAVVTLLGAATAMAGSDPHQHWSTIETEHFDVHYYEGGEAVAHRVAAIAEEANATLAPVMGWEPNERTQIVLRDESDGANGFATASSYNQITVLAFPPEADSELGNFDDYLRVLVFHEYTHILHLDNATGLPGLGNAVFGKTFLPNNVLPDWLIEGIATWVESAYTPSGRVHDAFFEMYIRASVLAGEPIVPAELTGSPLRLPRATAWYAYGGTFVTWLVKRKGEDALRTFARLYGRRVLPYSVNLTAKEAFGETLVDLYDQWLADLRLRYAELASDLEAKGLVQGEAFTDRGEFNGSVRFRPGSRELVYVISDGLERSRMVLRDMDTGQERMIVRCYGGCSQPTFSPDGATLYYSRSEPYQTFYRYEDLVRVDVETGEVTRLTEGRRLRDPAVSPDGRTVAFVSSRWGKTDLLVRDLDTGDERVVVPSEDYRQPAAPTWAPDGKTLAISMQVDGVRDLYLVDVATGALSRLTRDVARDVHPAFTADGRYVLYSANPTGIWDIYAIRVADRQRFRVTRVLTGVMQPVVDSRMTEIVFRRYSTRGWDLARLPFNSDSWTPLPPAADTPERLAARHYEPDPARIREEEAYNPAWTLWPHSWFPDISFLTGDALSIGLTLTGSDVVGHHAWLVSSEWTTDDARPAVVATYVNSAFLPSISLSGAYFRYDRLAFAGSDTVAVEEEILLGSLSLGLPFPALEDSLAMAFRIDVLNRRPIDAPEVRPEPDGLRPRLPRTRTEVDLTTSWAYDDTESYFFSISPERGRRLSLSFHVVPPLSPEDALSYAFRYSWTEYLPALWLDHHVWALRAQGGVSGGEGRDVFRIGGIPDRSLVDDILNQRGIGGAQLRGYQPSSLSGDQFHLANAEYLFPILYVHEGIGTLPVFLGRVYGLVFADVGAATSGPFEDARWKTGIGAEVRATFDIMYAGSLTLRLGFGQGLAEGGESQVYFVSGGGF